jgi:hypothetical protein
MPGNDVSEVPSPGNGEGSAANRRRLYPVPDAAYELGISTRKCWTLVYAGRLPTVWLDGRRVVTADALDEFVANLPDMKPEMAA